MIVDLIIMSYALMMALLVYQAEKTPHLSIKVILLGLLLTPIVGFTYLSFYNKQLK